jgi:hypothetical protein
VLTADTYTSVLPTAQYKATEGTAHLVLDTARHDRKNIAIVARRSQQKPEGIASHTDSRPGVIAAHRPLQETRSDHRAWQPRGNHLATTVHIELNKRLYTL